MQKLKNLFIRPDYKKAVRYEGLNLPLVRSNEGLADNAIYLKSGVEQIDTLKKYDLIQPETHILDFGCGQGRLANSLLFAQVLPAQYIGIDTQKVAIAWCKRFIRHDHFEFHHLPAFNARYNTKASSLQKLPFRADYFDLIFLNSVFSHMLSHDIRFYLNEFYRVTKPGKALYATAFVEEEVPEETENPDGYFGGGHQPLTRVRFEKAFFLELFTQLGWEIIHFGHQEIKRTGQSVIVVRKPNN